MSSLVKQVLHKDEQDVQGMLMSITEFASDDAPLEIDAVDVVTPDVT